MTSQATDANADVQRLCRLAGLPRATVKAMKRQLPRLAADDASLLAGWVARLVRRSSISVHRATLAEAASEDGKQYSINYVLHAAESAGP